MTNPMNGPLRVDEPAGVQGYADVFSQVAFRKRPVILRRDGADLAAVISLEDLHILREALAYRDAEASAATIDWAKVKKEKPPQAWFDDNDNPFEPEAAL